MLSLSSLFEFSNLYAKDTNIGTTIWVETSKDNKELQHNIRLKVISKNNKMIRDEMCSVIFNRSGKIIKFESDNPKLIPKGKILRNLQKWIYLNINLLIQVWDRKITPNEFRRKMESLDIKIKS